MAEQSAGIHHITAIAGDPQRNLDFYAGVLGLRLVKKTVNYDDPGTYHLYFGDRLGAPGTILTFFPWTRAGVHGRPGAGQVTTICFAVPAGSLGFWKERFAGLHVDHRQPFEHRGETHVSFRDPDGLPLEIVEAGNPPSPDGSRTGIPHRFAVTGFHSATLSSRSPERTAETLSLLGFRREAESGDRLRMTAGEPGAGSVVEIISVPEGPEGRMGVGAVHHIAWRARNGEAQGELRGRIIRAGLQATPVIDRTYFQSVYFHEPGSILFEIATDPPGFSVDEPLEALGARLQLPAWLEGQRSLVEKGLPPLGQPSPAPAGESRTR